MCSPNKTRFDTESEAVSNREGRGRLRHREPRYNDAINFFYPHPRGRLNGGCNKVIKPPLLFYIYTHIYMYLSNKARNSVVRATRIGKNWAGKKKGREGKKLIPLVPRVELESNRSKTFSNERGRGERREGRGRGGSFAR